jgi:DNA-binding Lrp family transcriptional regulator
MHRYSSLFIESHDYEVKQFDGLISLFLAKCDGLLSPAEVLKLESKFKGIATFSPYTIPSDQKDMILAKLEFMKKHNIERPTEIVRLLTQLLSKNEKIGSSYTKYLDEFTANPDKPFKWYAGRLKVGESSVTRAYKKLRKSIDLRFGFYTNYPIFRLKHFVLYFQSDGCFQSSMLSKREFTRTLNYDTFGEWMWASFLVPDQVRILKEFKDSLARFAKEVLRDHHLYEVNSIGKHNNFSMFDGEKWVSNKEAFGIGALELAEANERILPRMKEFSYSDSSIKFDQVDFILAFLALANGHLKSSELRQVLKENGCGDLSPVTIQKRFAALRHKRAFFSICSFSGLGLTFAWPFAAECDERTLETLYHLFPMFPECWAYRTDKGVVGMILGPAEMASGISYVLQGIKGKVDKLLVTSRFSNIGTRSQLDLYKYWDAKKQYWDFERGFFDLTNGLRERH